MERTQQKLDVASVVSAKRILVLGPSGSGKSRFSGDLGGLLGIKVHHLDLHFWRPGWIPTPAADWERTVQSMAAEDAWIIDGTYTSTLAIRLPRAQAIVYVQSSRIACVLRVIRRKLFSSSGRPDAPSGEPVDRAFLEYIWTYPTRVEPKVRRLIEELAPATTVIHVRGPRGGKDLLRRITASQSEQDASSANSHSNAVPRSHDDNSA